MKNFIIFVCYFAVSLPTVFARNSLTYWVDPSCRDRGRQNTFDRAIEDAKNLARRGFDRLQNPQDANQKDVFSKMFKVASDAQPARTFVNSILGGTLPNGAGIAEYDEIQDRRQSNIRIHCDNDPQDSANPVGQRWRLLPDLPLQNQQQIPGYTPMAMRQRRPRQNPVPGRLYQLWLDEENQVVTYGRLCGEAGAMAVTTLATHRVQDQPDQRSVVSICDALWIRQYKTFDDLGQNADLTALTTGVHLPQGMSGMNYFRVIMSTTILHEFCHVLPHRRTDVPSPRNPGQQSYLWGDVVRLSADQSLNNVNNFLFFALLAKIADRGYRLSIDPTNWHERGALVYFPSVRRVVRRWSEVSAGRGKCDEQSDSAVGVAGKVCRELVG